MQVMEIKRVVPNITTNLMDASVEFYTAFLGFRVAMDMEWIVTLSSPTSPTAQISLIRGEPASSRANDITLSIEVDDVDRLYAVAESRKYVIPYPVTNEPWGVRRFHVNDPNGVTLNIMCHIG